MVRIELSNSVIESFWYSINDHHGLYIRPIDQLTDWRSLGRLKSGNLLSGDETTLLDFSINNFEEIIKSIPSVLRSYISSYVQGKSLSSEFLSEFEDKMRYSKFRGSAKARSHFRKLNIKACPYCNAQFTVSIGKTGKVLCHFDHVYPKSDYPFLALSIYNLIPCCSYCNQAKSNDDPLHKNFIHPFEDSISNKFRFKASHESIKDYLTKGKIPKGGENLSVSNLSTSFNMIKFNLLDLYNEHTDVIQESYIRALVYNKEYIDAIAKEFSIDSDDINRVVNGNYMTEADINQRPLSKLQQDLKGQFDKLKGK